MGRWGANLFEGDRDLDTVCDIDGTAQEILKEGEEFTLLDPKNKEAVVAKLNDGLFDVLLQFFKEMGDNYTIMILVALTMQLGAQIPKEDIKDVRRRLGRTEMLDESKDSLRKGLKAYKNDGQAWDFGNLSLAETANKISEEEEAAKEAEDKKAKGKDVAPNEEKDSKSSPKAGVKASGTKGKKSKHDKPAKEKSDKPPKKKQKVSSMKDEE
ncbi:MAG: hypothetical protein Q9168_005843 [Polycauliona sp. 1 TL-2023]